MTDFATIDSAIRIADGAQGTRKLPPNTYGLGPNQLNWLRANIVSFRHAEHQRALLRHDVVRAARLAGLF